MSLVIEHLSGGYGEKQEIVRDLCYQFPPGINIVMGRNGEGKSTLIRLCAGVLAASMGSLTYNGRAIDARVSKLSDLCKVGYLPHRTVCYGRLNGWQHFRFWSYVQGIALGELMPTIRRLVSALAMSDFIDNDVATYSRGQQQKLAVAQCLMFEPNVVFMDEPLSSLDPKTREQLRLYFDGYVREKDRTIIATSHEYSEVSHLTKNIVLLSRGILTSDEGELNAFNEVSAKVAG